MQLLEEMDNLIDQAKKNLFQFEVETPHIPAELISDFIRLTQTSVSAAESTIPAAKSYFNEPVNVNEKIHRVYFYEKETDMWPISSVGRYSRFPVKAHKFHLGGIYASIENIQNTTRRKPTCSPT